MRIILMQNVSYFIFKHTGYYVHYECIKLKFLERVLLELRGPFMDTERLANLYKNNSSKILI